MSSNLGNSTCMASLKVDYSEQYRAREIDDCSVIHIDLTNGLTGPLNSVSPSFIMARGEAAGMGTCQHVFLLDERNFFQMEKR